jgi:hypothetical protein
VFREFREGYAAFMEELPGANTQGATLDEARENLKEAVAMVLRRTASGPKKRCVERMSCANPVVLTA